MKKHKLYKLLSLALVLVMALSLLPVSALAAGTEVNGPARTGDTRPVVLWIVLMAVSAVAIIVLIVVMCVKHYKPKYSNEDQKKDSPEN